MKQWSEGKLEKAIADLLKGKMCVTSDIAMTDYDKDIEKVGRMTGDDAYEFMVDYKEKFNVDMKDFDFTKHFGSEGLNCVPLLMCLLGKKREHSPLSIRQLAIIAQEGKWPAPTEQDQKDQRLIQNLYAIQAIFGLGLVCTSLWLIIRKVF